MIKSVEKLKDEAARLVKEFNRPTVVVAGGKDKATLLSLKDALDAGLVQAVITGPEEEIKKEAAELGFDISTCRLLDEKSKEGSISRALDLAESGDAQLLMKGNVKTGDLLREYLKKERGLRTGRIMSHVGLFDAPDMDKIMLITDGGLNLSPDLERKKDIIANAAEILGCLNVDYPKVAVLAHVEKAGNLDLPMVRDAASLMKLSEEGALGNVVLDGPLAFDLAVSKESARIKGVESPVAGQADILLAHDIGMGNVIFKMVQVWIKSPIASLVVGGRIPVISPSRADSAASKLASVALGVIYSIKSSFGE